MKCSIKSFTIKVRGRIYPEYALGYFFAKGEPYCFLASIYNIGDEYDTGVVAIFSVKPASFKKFMAAAEKEGFGISATGFSKSLIVPTPEIVKVVKSKIKAHLKRLPVPETAKTAHP